MRHSISKRLGLATAAMAGLLLLLVMIFCYFQAKSIMEEQIEEKVQGALANTNGNIEKILTETKILTEDIAWAIENAMQEGFTGNPDRFFAITREVVSGSPDVNSMAIGFAPETFPSKGRYFAPFTYRIADTLKTIQLGSKESEYFYDAWFQIPSLLKKSRWIDPYTGRDKRYIASYSVPVMRGDSVIAVVVSDIDIGWITRRIDSLNVLPGAQNIMVAADGRFVANTDTSELKHTIFTSLADIPDSASLVDAAHRMMAGEKGMLRYRKDRKWKRFYYAPLATTGWSSGVFCDEKTIFHDTVRFFNIMALLGILGLALLYFICRYVVSHFTKPLTSFANAAKKIAEGDFNVELPDSSLDDEIHMLHDSTDYMQKSLVKYIEEVQNVTANKERVESELRVAHDIQMGMVPKIFPPFPDRKDIDIYAYLLPAKEVGGDLYDFFISEEKLYFIIGDVSGKGVPASLVMAVARSMFRSIAGTESDPSKILSMMNDSLSESNPSDMFVTAFAGVLHLSDGLLEYCDAGHNYPMIVGPRNGEAFFLDADTNLALATIGGFTFKKQSITLKPGTTIFLYTDGLTEAENAREELYGEKKLEVLMKHEGLQAPKDMIQDVLNSVRAHVKDAEQSDDLTMLAIKYL